MNFFYAPPENWKDDRSEVEITGQEAIHISKVLRNKVGDQAFVVDGIGNRSKCEITDISKKSVQLKVLETNSQNEPTTKKVMAFGAIKKRDRLEFAIEKAVELDVWEICVFDADHSERSRLNEDRLHTQIVSAFKQSGRFYLPKLVIKRSLDEVLEQYKEHSILMAYLGDEEAESPNQLTDSENLLLVGPEGGFSKREADFAKSNGAQFFTLGKNRLRAETAVVAFLSQFLFSK
ncbi:MAG: 16S rRNA (uracil(1498)-N(3))-methyltransferase [Balneola sp.]|nr:16S rRNA (uracil(1498)-N(3))-methyltransferase [Balneola sp.]MBO6651894.1 16S rRNA (uracil(1498)-N(3))-methyltransferase [Balneola sp.]MBO6709995.1 16S rRNA (uracil(1498)-N(3))-methyltransferase [Balneola sp.]MBO6798679.1 16S rRNA (uracil(1498)-N(3))-methyltransferase [Balneola sp.]MBO6869793.1 16S rRNA (uracil(1498)-N(3))-methyltransferase [Balneola sp.]